MKRITAFAAIAVAGSILLTGCGMDGGKSVNPPAKGMVYEREMSLDSNGNTVYELSLTTDRKSIRRKASRSVSSSKKKDIKVSSKVYKNCGLKEMYPACK